VPLAAALATSPSAQPSRARALNVLIEQVRVDLQSLAVEGRATITSEILASYAADAAREVDGLAGLVALDVVDVVFDQIGPQ
jgi:hypothetical protein